MNYERAARIGPPSDNSQEGTSESSDLSALLENVPTLIIWGKQDRVLLTSKLEGLERFVPHMTIKRIPDGTLWVLHEKPELVNAAIRAFIKDHWSRREAS